MRASTLTETMPSDGTAPLATRTGTGPPAGVDNRWTRVESVGPAKLGSQNAPWTKVAGSIPRRSMGWPTPVASSTRWTTVARPANAGGVGWLERNVTERSLPTNTLALAASVARTDPVSVAEYTRTPIERAEAPTRRTAAAGAAARRRAARKSPCAHLHPRLRMRSNPNAASRSSIPTRPTRKRSGKTRSAEATGGTRVADAASGGRTLLRRL
jgi:hypothetical protein